jgi:hypothetical protein
MRAQLELVVPVPLLQCFDAVTVLDLTYLGRSVVEIRIVLVNDRTILSDGGQTNFVRRFEHLVEDECSARQPHVVMEFRLCLGSCRGVDIRYRRFRRFHLDGTAFSVGSLFIFTSAAAIR